MSDRKEHDKFCQQALANPLIAKEFFEEYLPTEIKVLFLPSTLKLENDRFYRAKLKRNYKTYAMLLQIHCKSLTTKDVFIVQLLTHLTQQ